MTVHFVPDTLALNHFRSWNGTLGQAFGRLEKETVWRQRELAGKRTGKLKAGVTSKRSNTVKGNLAFDAGVWTVSYARIHEEGSRPHVIRAKNAVSLTFFWPKVGRVVHYKSVQHPGTRPYRFLTRGAEAAMRMWGRGG